MAHNGQLAALLPLLLPLLRAPAAAVHWSTRAMRCAARVAKSTRSTGGIVRMLAQVDPLLARELEAQAKALDEYLDQNS